MSEVTVYAGLAIYSIFFAYSCFAWAVIYSEMEHRKRLQAAEYFMAKSKVKIMPSVRKTGGTKMQMDKVIMTAKEKDSTPIDDAPVKKPSPEKRQSKPVIKKVSPKSELEKDIEKSENKDTPY